MERAGHGVVEVAIAIVRRGEQWLVARRPVDVHLGGYWEFPGGKIHDGESPTDAALRELHEECHVEARVRRVLDERVFDYGDRVVRITPVLCEWVAGEPIAKASDAIKWVDAAELQQLSMPAVNGEIVRAALAAGA